MAVDPRAASLPLPAPAAEPVPRMRDRAASGVDEAGGIIQLAFASIVCWFTPPFSWWREAVMESWILVRRSLLPTTIALFVFGYGAAGVQAGSVLELFGAQDRVGAVFSIASLREFVPWVAGMVVAGVAGTAITADVGARKVRDELDAMAVIGVDVVRSLIAPRVLALTLLMPALNLVGLVIAAAAGVLATMSFNGPAVGYFETFKAGFTTVDLVANIIKTLGFGFIVATICCYKGMNASGGSEGVGRAVNQAIVLAFAAVWIFNFAFNSSYQATFPTAQDVR